MWRNTLGSGKMVKENQTKKKLKKKNKTRKTPSLRLKYDKHPTPMLF